MKYKKTTWVLSLALLVIYPALLFAVYKLAQASSREVGELRGKIEAREELIGRLEDLKVLTPCGDNVGDKVELFSVKANSLYLVQNSADDLRLCIER